MIWILNTAIQESGHGHALLNDKAVAHTYSSVLFIKWTIHGVQNCLKINNNLFHRKKFKITQSVSKVFLRLFKCLCFILECKLDALISNVVFRVSWFLHIWPSWLQIQSILVKHRVFHQIQIRRIIQLFFTPEYQTTEPTILVNLSKSNPSLAENQRKNLTNSTMGVLESSKNSRRHTWFLHVIINSLVIQNKNQTNQTKSKIGQTKTKTCSNKAELF